MNHPSLARFLWLSALFHAGLSGAAGLALVLVGWVGVEPPLRPDSIEVAMVSLPKSARNVPDRAARVKRATGDEPRSEPPPVRQSDLAVQQAVPDPKPGNADDAVRQEVLDQLQRERLLEDLLSAPDGSVDRNATDPNGADDAALAAIGAGARADPEFARWYAQVQQMMMSRFKPIDAITSGRSLACIVTVISDPQSGRVLSYEITSASGALMFDSTAEQAVASFDALPLPPEKYRPLLKQGVGFRFVHPAP